MKFEDYSILSNVSRMFSIFGLCLSFLFSGIGLPFMIPGLVLAIIAFKNEKEKEEFFALLYSVIAILLDASILLLAIIF